MTTPDSSRPATASDTPQAEMDRLWPQLSLDEKRYLVVRPVLESDNAAARYVGKGKGWLTWVRRKAAFKRAIELRPDCTDEHMQRLLDADVQLLLRADMAGRVQAGELGRKDQLELVKLLARLNRDQVGQESSAQSVATLDFSKVPEGITN